MQLLNLNYYLLVLLLLFLVLVLIIYVLINYYLYKSSEVRKTGYLEEEIILEKWISKKIKETPKEIEVLSKKTFLKFQIIKVDILSINFTLKEFFKSI